PPPTPLPSPPPPTPPTPPLPLHDALPICPAIPAAAKLTPPAAATAFRAARRNAGGPMRLQERQAVRADSIMQLRPEYLRKFRSKDRKSTRLNSSHQIISYAVFCLKKKTK